MKKFCPVCRIETEHIQSIFSDFEYCKECRIIRVLPESIILPNSKNDVDKQTSPNIKAAINQARLKSARLEIDRLKKETREFQQDSGFKKKEPSPA
jgi:hypothetical protein